MHLQRRFTNKNPYNDKPSKTRSNTDLNWSIDTEDNIETAMYDEVSEGIYVELVSDESAVAVLVFNWVQSMNGGSNKWSIVTKRMSILNLTVAVNLNLTNELTVK